MRRQRRDDVQRSAFVVPTASGAELCGATATQTARIRRRRLGARAAGQREELPLGPRIEPRACRVQPIRRWRQETGQTAQRPETAAERGVSQPRHRHVPRHCAKVGGRWPAPLLLLTTTGARRDSRTLNPHPHPELQPARDHRGHAGAPTHPDWHHNLIAKPDVTIEEAERKPSRRKRGWRAPLSGQRCSRCARGCPEAGGDVGKHDAPASDRRLERTDQSTIGRPSWLEGAAAQTNRNDGERRNGGRARGNLSSGRIRTRHYDENGRGKALQR